MPSTRSDRLIFANARTRMAELVDGDALGRSRHVDPEHVGAERFVERDLRERQRQVEALAVGARELDPARQAVLEVAVLGAPLARRARSRARRAMDDRGDL